MNPGDRNVARKIKKEERTANTTMKMCSVNIDRIVKPLIPE
jgi:hypothetical protein